MPLLHRGLFTKTYGVDVDAFTDGVMSLWDQSMTVALHHPDAQNTGYKK